MSPIIELQRRLAQAGRIRIGQQVPTSNGKSRPAKLSTFRFTSANRRAIEAVAQLYGGEPHPWEGAPTEGQWEVLTAAAEIPVVLPPERLSFTQWYELWSGGGCQRRCDGATMEDGAGCICDPEKRECDIHTRLSVMLAKLPGIGLWRLDTKGYYAATELGGAFEIAEMLTNALGRSVLPGLLRLEERVVKRGQTLKFVVPVLDFEVDMGTLALGGPAMAALPAGTTAGELEAPSSGLSPIPASTADVPSVAEQLQAVGEPPAERRRANSPPAIPASGLAPRSAVEAESAATVEPPRPPAPAAAPAKRARKAQGATKKAPAADLPVKKAQASKKAAAQRGNDEEMAQPRTPNLPNGEPRVTDAMMRQIHRLFGKLDTAYTRDQRLRYTANVAKLEKLESTWDLSVGQAHELVEHLKEITGEEPPL